MNSISNLIYRSLLPILYVCVCSFFTPHYAKATAPCTFTSESATVFQIGVKKTFTIATTEPSSSGSCALFSLSCGIGYTGTLPDGISFDTVLHIENGIEIRPSRAYFIGTAKIGSAGTYTLTLSTNPSACTGDSPTQSQIFTLTVIDPNEPQIATVTQARQVKISDGAVVKGKIHDNSGIDYANVIKWKAPKYGPRIVTYKIYSDANRQHLIAKIPSNKRSKFKFVQPHVDPKVKYEFYIFSFDKKGQISEPAFAMIKGKHHIP